MITPIITSLAREVIETTPAADKEAALALGATRWEMIPAPVLPHSKGGLVGAVMLGLGRAMGETIAAALVIGSALGQITPNLFAPGNSMPAVIANEWGEADDAAQVRADRARGDAVRRSRSSSTWSRPRSCSARCSRSGGR